MKIWLALTFAVHYLRFLYNNPRATAIVLHGAAKSNNALRCDIILSLTRLHAMCITSTTVSVGPTA